MVSDKMFSAVCSLKICSKHLENKGENHRDTVMDGKRTYSSRWGNAFCLEGLRHLKMLEDRHGNGTEWKTTQKGHPREWLRVSASHI